MVEETNDNKWENPEETELELQLRSHLDSNKSDPAVNDPELDLERLGDEDEECSKTMPIGYCKQKEEKESLNDVEKMKSLRDEKDPAEAEEKKKKKVETKKLKLMASKNPED